MLSEKEVRALLYCRVVVREETCNSWHGSHVEGQIRALIAVLTREPPPRLNGSVMQVFDLAGIPFVPCPDDTSKIDVPDEWMLSHGFEKRGDDYRHPEFSDNW